MTSTDAVLVERNGPVTILRLNAPPLNAFHTEMRDSLRDAIRQVGDDAEVRSVVLTGNERAFAAGADIQSLLAMTYTDIVDWNRRLQLTFTSLAELTVPVVAAIRGYALGGGFELALCADYRIAGETATLALPEVTLGIMPGSGGTQRLTEIVGRSRAKELLLTGRRLSASEALALGIVDEVVPATDTETSAVDFATRLAKGPRYAIRAIKEAVDHAAGSSANDLALERSLLAGLFSTPDRELGMRSFLTDGPGHAHFE